MLNFKFHWMIINGSYYKSKDQKSSADQIAWIASSQPIASTHDSLAASDLADSFA